MKVKVLTPETLDEGTKKEEDKPKAQILTPEYVAQLNRGIGYKIGQSQARQARAVVEAQVEKSVFD